MSSSDYAAPSGLTAETADDTPSPRVLPPRRLAEAHRVDQELIDLLPRMLADDEIITARAVARRMLTTGQASTITRDAWRMARVAEYQERQQRQQGTPETENAASEAPSTRVMQFRDLHCFASVARNGNFGRAGRELNIAHSTLINQVQRLEAALGTQLLVRHSNGVTPTDVGSRLLDRLDTIVNLLAAPLEPEPATPPGAGILSLALPAEAGLLLAPMLAEQVRSRWPQLTLDIKVGHGAAPAEWVMQHQADVAVAQDPPILDTLQIEPVLSERLGLVMSPRSPLAAASQFLRFRDLTNLPLILPNQQHVLRQRLEDAAFRHGIRLKPILQVDHVALTKTMVRNDLGCSILPSMAVQDELARGALVFRPIDRPTLITVHAVVLRRGTPSPVVVALASLVRRALTALVEQGSWPGARIIKAKPNPNLARSDVVLGQDRRSQTNQQRQPV